MSSNVLRFGSRQLVSVLSIVLPALAGCGRQPAGGHQAAEREPAITITIGGGCGALGPAPELVGTSPPNWRVTEWINSQPLRLEDLRGKAVLVRWFMAPSCPDCSATAPALREFDELYRDAGLAVIGMFHNSDQTLDEVREIVNRDYGYMFPVAIDRETATRREWTFGGDDCGYSDPYRSVTILLDRRGMVQYVHHEGRYVKGDRAYDEMRGQIERLLMDQPRVDDLLSRADRLTDVEVKEVEALMKAQERVALAGASLSDLSINGSGRSEHSAEAVSDRGHN